MLVPLTLEPHPKKNNVTRIWGPFGPQSCHGLPKHESVTYLATHVTHIRTTIKYDVSEQVVRNSLERQHHIKLGTYKN